MAAKLNLDKGNLSTYSPPERALPPAVGWEAESHSQKLSVQLTDVYMVNICGFNPTSFHMKETPHRTANWDSSFLAAMLNSSCL